MNTTSGQLLINASTGEVLANLGSAPVSGTGGDNITLNIPGFGDLTPTEEKPDAPPTDPNATLEDIFGKRSMGASGSW